MEMSMNQYMELERLVALEVKSKEDFFKEVFVDKEVLLLKGRYMGYKAIVTGMFFDRDKFSFLLKIKRLDGKGFIDGTNNTDARRFFTMKEFVVV